LNRTTPSTTDLVLWLALLAGFSPVIAEFVRGFTADFTPPSTLLAPVLIAICVWRGTVPAERPHRAGAALIAAGLVLELSGITSQIWTVAWLGFPVAVVGMALWVGRPSWRVAVLAFGLVPVPVSLEVISTPTAETALLSGACAIWRAVGLAFTCTGPVARLADRHLELQSGDAGWTLALVLAELGWFVAIGRGAGPLRALRAALAFAAAVVVVQPLAVGLALGLFAVGSMAVARAWLSPGVWLCCATAVLLGCLRGGVSSRPTHGHTAP
jgi:hypothetical protein